MKIRLLAPLLIAIALPAGILMPVHAETIHRHMIVDTFAEGVSGYSEVSALADSEVQKILKNIETDYHSKVQKCEAIDQGPCAGKTGLSFRIYLPVCDATTTEYCISDFSISPGNGAPLQKASFLGYTGGHLFKPDPSRGFPGASTPSRWKATGVMNSGNTDTYAVKFLLDGFALSDSSQAFVFEASATIDGYTENQIQPMPDGRYVASGDVCNSWQDEKVCGKHESLKDGQRISLSVHLPNTVTGWLHGRLKSPSISVNKVNANQNEVTVEADTVVVPELSTILTDAQFNSLPNPSYFTTPSGYWDSVNGGNTAALEWIKQLSGVLKDTATGEHSAWSFATAPGNANNSSCFNDKTQLIGLVTTNALAYSPGAPEFDGTQLNYQVAGLHYRPNGTDPNLGTYDLSIRSTTARCLYQFTNAPLTAVVSVTDGKGGEKQVATTVLTEKDGWLHLGAYGFTFSSPILHVKFKGTPLKGSTNSNNSSNSPNSSKAGGSKSYTVTCVKGKVVKKIITPAPNCPYGWKKK